jgi:hypothetical protein
LTDIYRTEARLSMLSMSSQPADKVTPHYVAELSEAQAFVADIPPLVSSKLVCNIDVGTHAYVMIGTSCL